MTNDEAVTQGGARLPFEEHGTAYLQAMGRLARASVTQLDEAGIDHRLRELLKIRASQLNGCAYCIDMHTKDARALGETEQRLYALPAWSETPFYSERERAALAFAESVTRLAANHVSDEDYERVAEHFRPDEIAALLTLIVTINAWNTLAATSRAWTPGSYQPA
jgi:AhpD family alkylhydroperoxidase